MDADLRYLDWNDVEYIKPADEPVGTNISARAIVMRNDGRVLLVKPQHDARWDIPGGTITPGELLTDAAVREVIEETGLTVVCEPEPFSFHERGFYNPRLQKFYHSFVIVFLAQLVAGQDPEAVKITDTEEIEEVAWLDPKSLDLKDIHAGSQSAFKKFLAL